MENFKEILINLKTDIRIWAETFGNSKNPALLLIGGAGCQCKIWPDEFCEKLMDCGFYVIRYDHRDTGKSSEVDYKKHPYTIKNLTEDAIGVLDHLGVTAAHILGYSMGGEIALFIGAYYPTYTKTITLLGTSTSFKEAFDVLEGKTNSGELSSPIDEYVRWATRNIDVSNQSKEEKINDFIQTAKILSGTKFPFDEKFHRIMGEQIVARSNTLNFYQNHPAAMKASFQEHLEAAKLVKAKTLIIHGDQDPVFGIDHAYSLKKSIKNSKLNIISGLGHNLNPILFTKIALLIKEHSAD